MGAARGGNGEGSMRSSSQLMQMGGGTATSPEARAPFTPPVRPDLFESRMPTNVAPEARAPYTPPPPAADWLTESSTASPEQRMAASAIYG
jgi:hypothetical protein